MRTHYVAFALFENCELLDVAGPASVFNFAARLMTHRQGASQAPYETHYYSLSGGLIRTIEGACIDSAPLATLERSGADTLIIAGGPTRFTLQQTELAQWLTSNADRFSRIGAVCTAAYLLAQAGLLNGRRAVTHWEDCEEMSAMYPAVEVDREALFVTDRSLWTCAGASSGIDMALAMLEDDIGRSMAIEVAQQMVVFVKRDSRQPQLSTLLQSQSKMGPLENLLVWATEHPAADLSVENLAARANMSLRTFYRNFERQTGMRPGAWVESSRVEAAKRLLEQSDKRIEQIAVEVGFGSYERMRRAFLRTSGDSPTAHRQRFCTRRGLAAS